MRKKLPENVVRPIDLVQNSRKTFIGFLMDRVNGEELRRLSSKKFVVSNGITKKDISEMLVQVKDTLKKLHRENIFVGDLNDMNILFDDDYNVHFIDVDSWSVSDTLRCTVVTVAFKDPSLRGTHFDAETDAYAFAILIYKLLTRLHPFGGTLKCASHIMPLTERMSKRLSIISKDAIIPKMVDQDDFLSSDLKEDLLDVLERGKRRLIDSSLDDFRDNLEICKSHGDYYYSIFNECPVCVTGAKEARPIVKIMTVSGVPVRLIFANPRIKLILSEDAYIDIDNQIIFRRSPLKAPFKRGIHYYTNERGDVLYTVSKEEILVKTPKSTIQIEKKFDTRVQVVDNAVYFISNGLNLNRLVLLRKDCTAEEKVATVSINNVFHIHDSENYFVCNSYDHAKVIDVSGYNHQLNNMDKVVEYGIHFDEVTKRWLFIFKKEGDTFWTYVFDSKGKIIYSTDKIPYVGELSNICFNKGIIFIPSDGAIMGFDYKTNRYKEFKIPVVYEGTILVRKRRKFIAINEREIYEIG